MLKPGARQICAVQIQTLEMGQGANLAHECIVRMLLDQVDRHDVSERILPERFDEPARPRRFSARRRLPAVLRLPFVGNRSARPLNGRNGVALRSDHRFPAAVEYDERQGCHEQGAGDRAAAVPEADLERNEGFPEEIECGELARERRTRGIGGEDFGGMWICGAHRMTSRQWWMSRFVETRLSWTIPGSVTRVCLKDQAKLPGWCSVMLGSL